MIVYPLFTPVRKKSLQSLTTETFAKSVVIRIGYKPLHQKPSNFVKRICLKVNLIKAFRA